MSLLSKTTLSYGSLRGSAAASWFGRSVWQVGAATRPPQLPLSNGCRRSVTTHAQLPEEHRMVYEMCRKFADEVLAPQAGTWDQKHEFPKDAVQQLVGFSRRRQPG